MVRDPRDAVPGIADAANERLAARAGHRRPDVGPRRTSPPSAVRTPRARSRWSAPFRILGAFLAFLVRPLVYVVRDTRRVIALARTTPTDRAPLDRSSAFSTRGLSRVLDVILLVTICVIGSIIVGTGVAYVAANILAFSSVPFWVRVLACYGLAWMAWLMIKLGIDVVRWFFLEVGVGYWALLMRALAIAFALMMLVLFFPLSAILESLGLREPTPTAERFGVHVLARLDALVPPSTHRLPSHLAQRRLLSIVRAYEELLAKGDPFLRGVHTTVMQYAGTIEGYAQTHGIAPERIAAVIAQESSGVPNAVSSRGAAGLMQLMPATATEHGAACGILREADRSDPTANICTGTTYLRYLEDAFFPGDGETAVAAYNGGPTAIRAQLDALPRGTPRTFWAIIGSPGVFQETSEYVPLVLAWEYVFRYLDATDALPPDVGVLLANGGGAAETPSFFDRFRFGGFGAASAAMSSRIVPSPIVTAEPVPDVMPTGVWYTARADDRYTSIVHTALRDPDPASIAMRNQGVAAAGVRPGMRIYLPEDRYAFHTADGIAPYEAIAQRYGMRTVDLLRLSGVWSDRDLAVTAERDCDRSGCDDALRIPHAGIRVLVRSSR